MNTQEIDNIKQAILRGDKLYKGIKLPSTQKSGTDGQKEGYALQSATRIWKENLSSVFVAPKTIKTTERIFKILTVEGDLHLCNVEHLKIEHLLTIKRVWHLWNLKFERLTKPQLENIIKS